MTDYIDRQAAIDAINRAVTKEVARWSVKELPSAEVEPVKRGKWTPHSEICREYVGTVLLNVEYDYWFCDACGYQVKGGRPMYNFCPNCGAKMEGAEE